MGAVSSRRAGQGSVSTGELFFAHSQLSFGFHLLRMFICRPNKMSSSDPLKSAIPFKIEDETSLALPSKNQYGSGEQRVRAQVQTIRRMKSRHSSSGRSGSTLVSPTSRGLYFTVYALRHSIVELCRSGKGF